TLLAFHRLIDDPRAVRGAALGASMAAQTFFCGYYALFVALIVGFGVMYFATTRRLWRSSRFWTTLAVAAAVAITASSPVVLAYVVQQRSTGFARVLDNARQWSADWRAYLASGSYAHRWMQASIGHWKEVLFPGFVATAFGAAGAIVGWRTRGRMRETAVFYGALAALAWWASLGPDAGLYRILYSVVPMFRFLRAPSRFGIVVAFALSTLAGIGVSALLRRSSRPALVAAALGAAATLELAVPVRFPAVPTLNPVYGILATLPPGPA